MSPYIRELADRVTAWAASYEHKWNISSKAWKENNRSSHKFTNNGVDHNNEVSSLVISYWLFLTQV
jgi:hypothetical protein